MGVLEVGAIWVSTGLYSNFVALVFPGLSSIAFLSCIHYIPSDETHLVFHEIGFPLIPFPPHPLAPLPCLSSFLCRRNEISPNPEVLLPTLEGMVIHSEVMPVLIHGKIKIRRLQICIQ